MEKHKLIKAYYKNQLSDHEIELVDRLIVEDHSFKKEFEEYKSLQTAFRINEAERLKNRLQSIENSNIVESSTPLRKQAWFYPLAATLLIVIGATFYYNFFNADLYAQHFEVYPNVYQPVVRGTSDADDITPFIAYENAEYSKAERGFLQKLDQEENPNLRFYLALSYLNQEKFKESIDEFYRLKDLSFGFQAEVYWYSALAQIKLENYEEAKDLLLEMQNNNMDFKSESVGILLEEL